MIAYPMRCVNDTLPPRVRRRWLLITMRLSNRSFAGTARTLVAVGIVSERSMFLAITAAAPRSGLTSSWSSFAAGLAGAAFAGVALTGSLFAGFGSALGWVFASALVSGRGSTLATGFGGACLAGGWPLLLVSWGRPVGVGLATVSVFALLWVGGATRGVGLLFAKQS